MLKAGTDVNLYMIISYIITYFLPRMYSGKIVSKAPKLSMSQNFVPGPGNYDPSLKNR